MKDVSSSAALRRSKRICRDSSTTPPRHSERILHDSSTAAPLPPTAAPLPLKRNPMDKKMEGLRAASPKSKKTPPFSYFAAFEALIEPDNKFDITTRYSVQPYKSAAARLRGQEALKSVFDTPLFSVPHYTEADLKPDSNILTTVTKSADLALSANQVPPLHPPAVPRFILKLKTGGVIGRLTYREIGSEVDCMQMWTSGKAVPPDCKFVEDMKSDALFILLVGNDSAFMELADEYFYNRFPCIIITAEGPPDFLFKLKTDLKLPVLALLDCDPNWLKMLSFYGRGLKDIKWLGIRPTDFGKYKMGEKLTLPMSNKDIKTAKGLLKDNFVNQNPKWLHELEVMLECNRKTELDALICFGYKYLTRVFLPMKLQEEDWI